MKEKIMIDLIPTWSALLPALLAVLSDGTEEGKQFALVELKKMARVADLYVFQKTPKPRQGPSRRELVIQTLQSAGRPIHTNVVSKATGIPGTAFASILRDEKTGKRNHQGRLHIVGFRKDGHSFLTLSTWGSR